MMALAPVHALLTQWMMVMALTPVYVLMRKAPNFAKSKKRKEIAKSQRFIRSVWRLVANANVRPSMVIGFILEPF